MTSSHSSETDPTAVRHHIVACLRRLLPEDVPSLDDALDPIDDLGLESRDGIDFVVLLGKRLECDFPFDFNPFYDSAGRSRSIGRIVQAVGKKMESCKPPKDPAITA